MLTAGALAASEKIEPVLVPPPERKQLFLSLPEIDTNDGGTKFYRTEIEFPYENSKGTFSRARARFMLMDLPPYGDLGLGDIIRAEITWDTQGNNRPIFTLLDQGCDGYNHLADEFYDKHTGLKVNRNSSLEEKQYAFDREKEIFRRAIPLIRGR